MTTITNVRVSHIRPKYKNLKEWMDDSSNVYIGRGGIVFIDGERFPKQNSIWANPFKIGKNTIEECISGYETYIRHKIENEYGIEKLMELKGKNLGCWCYPNDCHGNTLIKLIDEYEQKI